MTVSIDWTTVDQPPIRLSLVRTTSGWHSVIDQHGSLYFPPTQDLTVCLRFLAAMREKKQAVVDDASVERATWFSVRVPDGLSERDGAVRWPTEAEPCASSRSESPSNVVPLRKGA